MNRIALLALVIIGCKSASKAPHVEEKPGSTGSGSETIGGGDTKGGPPDPEEPLPVTGRGFVDLDLDADFTTVGDIDKNAVKSTVKANMAKLRACYETTLLAYPGIEGKCVCTFKVAIDGSVREAKASGVHPDVEACVAEVVRSFKFPTSTAEVEVQYPFTFRAN
jgi:hypothetical protein